MLQVTKIVEFTKEVEIPLTAEDISQCLLTSPLESRKEATIEMVADCLKVLKAIPDTVIAELHPEFRKTVSDFLANASGRFNALGTLPVNTDKPACLDSNCNSSGQYCNVCINRNIIAKQGHYLIQIIESISPSVGQTNAVTAAYEFIQLAENVSLGKGVSQ
jgi:hypothetical protein